MKNTEVSGILGQLWRNMPMEKKHPYVEMEVKKREQYKIDMAEWRKQQETIQLAVKASGTTSSPVGIFKNDTQRKMQPVILENGMVARVYGGNHDVNNFVPYASHDPSASRGSYGESVRPSHMARYDQHQYHQHSHMYPEHHPQEPYIHHYTHKVYAEHYPHQQSTYLRPQQHGYNSDNGRYLNPVSFPYIYSLPYLGTQALQEKGRY